MNAGGEEGWVRGIIDPAVETDVIKLMAAAFDRALISLALVPPDIVRDAMVRRIIEAAQAGERSLGELANAALGGADTGGSGFDVNEVLPSRRVGELLVDALRGQGRFAANAERKPGFWTISPRFFLEKVPPSWRKWK